MSAAKTPESLIVESWNHLLHISPCGSLFDRKCTSSQLYVVYGNGGQLLPLISLAVPIDASAHAPCTCSLALLSAFNGIRPYNEQASLTLCQISHQSWREEGVGGGSGGGDDGGGGRAQG